MGILDQKAIAAIRLRPQHLIRTDTATLQPTF